MFLAYFCTPKNDITVLKMRQLLSRKGGEIS